MQRNNCKLVILAETSYDLFKAQSPTSSTRALGTKEIEDFKGSGPSEQRREDSKYSSTLRVHASRISRAYQTRDWQDSASQKHSFWSRKLTRLTRKFRQPQLKSKIQKRLWVVYQSGGWVWPSRIWVFARAYKTRGFSIWPSRI